MASSILEDLINNTFITFDPYARCEKPLTFMQKKLLKL